MLSRGIRQVMLLAAICTALLAATVSAEASERVTVSREQIVDAMQLAGFNTTATQLQLLSNVTSLPGATLRLAKFTKQSSETALAELDCKARQCLPFYVLVHDIQLTHGHAIFSGRNPNGPVSVTHPLISRGKPLTLLIQGANSRIVLPVVSLEGGGQGDVIKVSSPDRKRIYQAEIVSNTTVRSTL
jgi:hypothetical protein